VRPLRSLPIQTSIVWTACLFVLLISGQVAQAAVPLASSTDLIAGEIQQRLGEGGSEIRVRNETLDAEPLRRFYQRRGWHSAWSEMTEALLAVLAGAEADGLPVSSFHLNTLKSLLQTNSAAGLAERDLLLTDGLLRYAMAMRGQRIDPAEIEEDWFLTVPAFDAVEFLNENAKKLPTALLELRPLYAGYQLLSQKLVELKAVAAAGDWPKVPPGPPIKPGALDDRILDVRKRLAAAGLDAAPLGEPNFYDEALQSEVQLFQRRHGLNDDGVLGRQTVQTMNISAAERARQVAVNMERWRWLPARLEPNHIVVNVPGAWLEVVEGGKAVLSMRVIVGDPEHPTPALHAKMTSLVMNPIWRIPSSIATNEILPKLKKDPGYLIENDLELVSDSFAPGSPESQGVGISWKTMSVIPWPVRQRAGSDNALGRIKFNIPNDDDIYLHDTPNRKAFTRNFRALSHGCVRVEKPEDLALYALKDKQWSGEKLEQEIDKGETRTVSLGKSLPVWLLYWTSWVDGDGVLQFRDDLYERDQRLLVALSQQNRQLLQRDREQKTKPHLVRCEGCRLP